MDTIKFVVEDYTVEEFGYRFLAINIYINGVNLLDRMERIEHDGRTLLERWEPSEPGYVGLHPNYRQDFTKEFLGRKNRPYSVLLTCTCLEELCNSIVAKITVEADSVMWSDMRSGVPSSARSPGFGGMWKARWMWRQAPLITRGLGPSFLIASSTQRL